MARLLAWLGLATLAASAVPACAQTVVTSAAPDHVSVTLYRATDRSAETKIDRDSPEGYALITETRTVTLPAGDAVIRFEGVAGNILPESALVAGLPEGVGEKNLDASLLSPRSLFDRALGRRVIVRRTDPATGKASLLQATLRSGVDGAAVLQFPGGNYGDLRCSGLPEALVYDGVPPGLSARPTLSVRTTSAKEQRVTLTLSYLAGGFDWQADYIVAMREGGRSADLFAWITLASGDVTTFPDADLQVVAGKPNREDDGRSRNLGGDLTYVSLKCWPLPNYNLAPPEAPAPPLAPPMDAPMAGYDIVVTGARRVVDKLSNVPIAVTAVSEQLGDLKLYRFPRRVTVASNGQKQVGMLSKPSVKLATFYRSRVWSGGDASTQMLLRGRNVEKEGLGIALPGGRAAIFADAGGRSLMIAESFIADKAVGEEFELPLGEPGEVDADTDEIADKDDSTTYELTVTNANPWPIDYEASFEIEQNETVRAKAATLGRKNGYPLWTKRIPANGKVVLRYTIIRHDDEEE